MSGRRGPCESYFGPLLSRLSPPPGPSVPSIPLVSVIYMFFYFTVSLLLWARLWGKKSSASLDLSHPYPFAPTVQSRSWWSSGRLGRVACSNVVVVITELTKQTKLSYELESRSQRGINSSCVVRRPVGNGPLIFVDRLRQSCMVPSPLCSRLRNFEIYLSNLQ